MFNAHLIQFYRSMADSCQAGLPLNRGLRVLRSHGGGRVFKKMLADVDAGISLHDAMRRHPRFFPAWQTETVAAAEASGKLDEVFSAIAQSLEERRSLWLSLLPNLAYPVFFLHAAPGVLLAFGKSNCRSFFDFILPFYLAAVLLYVLYDIFRPTGMGRHFPILSSSLSADFASVLSLLVKSGASFPRAISMAGNAAGLTEKDPGKRAALALANKGAGAVDCMRALRLFTDAELEDLEIGESSGKLERVLDHLARNARQRNQAIIKSVLNVVPAIIMLVFAVIVGKMILRVYADNDPMAQFDRLMK